ncbi:type II toxin-antitoxin system death-on-curing family toxin [Burkholderia ubonensis]|uniref:Death-on-curing protein n=1 Tax=Burkholderia ubonensis TaxID=101571 RepID=A0ABD4DWG3_9BURK|nr:type II toxin-antitoxin system death-on-curing family toxin [Burkholderia ubonensis]KVN79224.1 death-on-curing protein [Burkholderia ubonensis]KVZ55332.1 death-on-curing protein [Burkholderia ubonensis]KVZ79782.1 death-on-curing protein [Burkholderia ubonensis]
MLDLDYVITIHDEIIRDLGGRGGVEAALHRVENHAHYAGFDDVFGIAATYATAIARGHVFNDANKRTGLTCALTYLEQLGITIPRLADLEEIMVEVADGQVTSEELAEYLSAVWELSQSARFTID